MTQIGRGQVIPGFMICNYDNNKAFAVHYADMCQESCEIEGWFVGRRTFNRFMDDKAFFVDDVCCIVLEGVILNKAELFSQYNVGSIELLVKKMREARGECFFGDFRGSFSGAYYDVKKKLWTIWTNHYGNNEIFYSDLKDKVCVGSNFWDVLSSVKRFDTVSLDERAVVSMLAYGGMNDNQTYAKEIKRLLPGHYIKISSSGELSVHAYWEFSRDAYSLSDSSVTEIIDELDNRFRRAVRRQFDKDDEYGYCHLAELSGGLDSRMISWVAHELGYSDVINVTFSQSNYLDELIAKRISTDLGNQCMVMPLDDAEFLLSFDEIIQLNFGLTVYSGTTGLKRFLDNLNIDKFGLIHSGTAGDVIVGSFLHDPSELNSFQLGGLYSQLLIDRAEQITDFSRYRDQEEYLIMTRAFLTVGTSDLVRRGYSDVASPFLDIDFFEYCMSIPLEYRCRHFIYKKWICTKYPDAARYIWEKQGTPVSSGPIRTWLSGKIRAMKMIGPVGTSKEILRHLGIHTASNKTSSLRRGMNPFDYWIEQHPTLKDLLDEAYQTRISSWKGSAETREMLAKAYDQGTIQESTLPLTVLSAAKRIFD